MWKENIIVYEDNNKRVLNFVGANYDEFFNPVLNLRYRLNTQNDISKVEIINIKYEIIPNKDLYKVNTINIVNDIEINHFISIQRKKYFLNVEFVPLIKDANTGEIKRILSFDINYVQSGKNLEIQKSIINYANESVLSSGDWYKVKVASDGVYKITYQELIDMGFSNITNVHVYGNGGKQLPYSNNEFHYDDLQENPIYINKGTDGIFNSGDYFLFYGQSSTVWSSDSLFRHTLNNYSSVNYYFITVNNNVPKTITTEVNTSVANTYVNSFNDFIFHEEESENLIKSGRIWYGEYFNTKSEYNFKFTFPNLVTTSPLTIRTEVAGRSYLESNFSVKINNQSIQNMLISPVQIGTYTASYAGVNVSITEFNSNTGTLNIDVIYNKPESEAEGWLNYIIINARRKLSMYGDQMHFRDLSSVGTGNITEFQLANTSSEVNVWDITDPINPIKIQSNYSGGVNKIKTTTYSLKQFIAFDGTGYKTVTNIGRVEKQNLHGISSTDYVIVSHSDFLPYANKLADIHKSNDGLKVTVVTEEQVFNEFSSGKPDVSAVRNFMKMLYDRAGSDSTKMPRYLLLFGDGSFDNRNTSSGNSNYILTYQSANSLKPTSSYVSDDYYGLLDNIEVLGSGDLDIGVGRFPVQTTTEASMIVEKVRSYMSKSTMGDWRNNLCFIGDDEDGNQHMSQANSLANQVYDSHPEYNIDKIMFDAYPQVSTPTGEAYPEVTAAVTNRVMQGALIVNYTGHGNEIKLAHENVITISDIMSWTNYDKLPVFITATCEFSRFDDFERTSGGETIILNSKGGGIALFTTTRLVYSSPNFALNVSFYNHAFENYDYRLGDLIRLAKNGGGSNSNKLNFTLLGDPALRMAYPQHNVVTTKINGKDISLFTDTIKALSKVTVDGYVEKNGLILNDFNGIIYPTVYDKFDTIVTLSNDGFTPFTFDYQHNVLFKGKASVKNGKFTFSFIVPKDISYKLDSGRISYYADNNDIDANGFYNKFIIGGSADSLSNDNQGPEVDLYMNDENFAYGGITDESPMILAFVSDSNGINTVGNGIGHDITATIDENTSQQIVLNEYYESDLDSYQSGKVEYFLSNLEDGNHTLKVKVWDVYNNSSEAYTEFIVAESSELVLDHVLNYPNPFTTSTEFYFEHNQPNSELDVLVQVFTVSGKLVKTLETTIYSNGYRSDPIKWDGLDDYGDKIGRGVYIYKLKVRSSNGNVVNKFEKLVILR